MRKIKFRAWDKNTKEMYKIGQITLERGSWDYEPDKREYIGMSIPYQPSLTVMQYTGLKDKNGQEIYEGDVVYIFPEDELGEVKWDKDTARFIVEYDNVITDFDNWYGKDLEVRGNIYDS